MFSFTSFLLIWWLLFDSSDIVDSSEECRKLTFLGIPTTGIDKKNISRKISSYWIYNPSFSSSLEGGDSGSGYTFVARMSWQYDSKCSYLTGSEAMHNCSIFSSLYKWQESTVVGIFNEASCTADISKNNILNSVNGWGKGIGWYDTRLLSWSGAKENNSKSGGMWMTAQRREVVRSVVWPNISDMFLLEFELLHTAFVSSDRIEKSSKLTRVIYYDVDNHHWTRGYTSKYILDRKADFPAIVSMLCHRLPNDEIGESGRNHTAFMAARTQSINTRKSQYVHHNATKPLHNTIGSIPTASHDIPIGCLRDKNWSPFLYRDRLLWSYSLSPHIVCENDIDLRRQKKEVDCVFCLRKYDSSNFSLWDSYSTQLMHQYNTSNSAGAVIKYHLNGLPAYRVHRENFYLGIAHAVLKYSVTDLNGKTRKHLTYVHFMYKLKPEPPFSLYALSKQFDLESDLSVAWWFPSHVSSKVSYVSGFEYVREAVGREFVIGYGVGDSRARVVRMSVEDAMNMFPR